MTRLLLVITILCAAEGAQAQYRGEDAQRAAARRAAVAAAQGQVDRAQSQLNATITRVRATWKANPELQNAEKSLEEAQASYNKIREAMISHLKNDPEYQAAIAEQEKLDAERPTTKPDDLPDRIDAAQQKLEKRSRVRELEEKAMASNPGAKEALAQLDLAREKMRSLELQLEAVLRNDPEYKSALEQLNSAKAQLTAATAQN